MKKRIVVENSTPLSAKPKTGATRDERLRLELRDNLKKRKAQARAKTEVSKNG